MDRDELRVDRRGPTLAEKEARGDKTVFDSIAMFEVSTGEYKSRLVGPGEEPLLSPYSKNNLRFCDRVVGGENTKCLCEEDEEARVEDRESYSSFLATESDWTDLS